jgi:hypothetical protein
MIFIISIAGPFSGLKDQADQNDLGKEHQPRRLVLALSQALSDKPATYFLSLREFGLR